MAFRFLRSVGFSVAALYLAGCGDAVFPPPDMQAEPPDEEPLAGEAGAETKDLVATEVYGELVVGTGRFVAESTIKPWSSWWFPISDDTLFAPPSESELSPLQKYDLYCRALNRNTTAAEFERSKIYDARAPAWAGLCDAWAIASIMRPEPDQDTYPGGIRFTVADLKALLLKTYEGATGEGGMALRHFGRRNNGRWDDDYADIFPEQFHRFLQAELFKEHRPFIMDHDAGIEVWNSPVWKAVIRIDRSQDQPDVVHVQTWLVSASPHVTDRNFTGMLEVTRAYTYDLAGEWKADGQFHVRSGQWTGRSRWDHPDFLIPKPDFVVRASHNTEIDVAVVDSILGAKRQP